MVRQSAAAYGHDLGELTVPSSIYVDQSRQQYNNYQPQQHQPPRQARGFYNNAGLRYIGVHLLLGNNIVFHFFVQLPPSPKKSRSSLETTEESCLALRYEALVMREEKSTIHPGLRVTCKEWLTLVEHLLENGFNSIANHACEKALMCTKANHVSHAKMDDLSCDVHSINKIMRLKDVAMLTISSQSVTQSYLKQKVVEQYTQHLVTSLEAQSSGSSRFRNGIIKHNLRKLNAYRCP
ncbi:hypothetical protein CASFOL_043044 [Castilleja foliolosa]|uniref:Uncharacterized protein n=1 Tax=Castilleja foliolosa TaxID=1961234 RepID=A0ABD3B6Y9_9LAMI